MSVVLVSLVAGVLGLFYYVWQYYRNVAKYPPGPMPLPLIGNFHKMSPSKLGENFAVLSKKYGNVFTVFIPSPLVILADYESVKEAFIHKGDDFAGRPLVPLLPEKFCENPGVISANGESWRENRRQAISILRDFGMGKGLMEEKVNMSIIEYLRFIDQIDDKEHVDLRWPIQLMVGNIINEMLFGYRYEYNDCDDLVNYVEGFNKFVTKISSSLIRYIAVKFPIIKRIPVLSYYAVGRFYESVQPLLGYIRSNVEKCLETFDKDAEPECFVHAYAQKIAGNRYLNENQLMAVCSDFFLAGQETTTTTLRWAVLLLAANQDVQDRLRAEIHAVVGTERLPSLTDKPKMPYTNATVHELQRRANIVQVNPAHRTTVDTEVMGHKIPKDTLVIGDIHQIMAADPIFENPEEFRPERYLSEDGKTLNKEIVERTIPFSIGKRQCAGEALARAELFLGLAATVQHYRILPSDDGPIDLTPENLLAIVPKTQRVCIEKVL